MFFKPNDYRFDFAFPVTHGDHEVMLYQPPSFIRVYNSSIEVIKNGTFTPSDYYSGGLYKQYSYWFKLVDNKQTNTNHYQQCIQLKSTTQNTVSKICFKVNFFRQIFTGSIISKKKMTVSIDKNDVIKHNVWLYLYNPYLTQSC